jgi:hypothetical protein
MAYVNGLDIETVNLIYERVTTDGNIYNSLTLPMLREIALEVEIGLLKDSGDDRVCRLFIPSMNRAFKDLQGEARRAADIDKDFELLNKVCFSNLSDPYYKEIGNMLYEYYTEHVKYILNEYI